MILKNNSFIDLFLNIMNQKNIHDISFTISNQIILDFNEILNNRFDQLIHNWIKKPHMVDYTTIINHKVYHSTIDMGDNMLKEIEIKDEKELEHLIINGPSVVEEGLKIIKHQLPTDVGPSDVICVDENGNRFGDSDCIRKLYFTGIGEVSGDDILCDVPCHI